MKFAKLIDECHIVLCPKSGESHGYSHTNLPLYYEENIECANEDGYYTFVERPRPPYSCRARYKMYENSILQEWEKIPEPKPKPSLDEQNKDNIEFLSIVLDIPVHYDDYEEE